MTSHKSTLTSNLQNKTNVQLKREQNINPVIKLRKRGQLCYAFAFPFVSVMFIP